MASFPCIAESLVSIRTASIAKPQHLRSEIPIGFRCRVARLVVQNTHASHGAFRNADGVLNGAVKDVQVVAVDLSDTLLHALAELRPGLVHCQQNACDLQIRIEMLLHRTYHIQHIRDTLGGEEVGLHGNNAVIRRAQRIDGQKLLLESAVDDDVVVCVAQRHEYLRQHLFRAAPSIIRGAVLRDLHNLKPRSCIR